MAKQARKYYVQSFGAFFSFTQAALRAFFAKSIADDGYDLTGLVPLKNRPAVIKRYQEEDEEGNPVVRYAIKGFDHKLFVISDASTQEFESFLKELDDEPAEQERFKNLVAKYENRNNPS